MGFRIERKEETKRMINTAQVTSATNTTGKREPLKLPRDRWIQASKLFLCSGCGVGMYRELGSWTILCVCTGGCPSRRLPRIREDTL
jgi:hypothetical protein